MKLRFPTLPCALLGSLLSAALVRATCYNPDGSEVTAPAFQPCNQVVGQVSVCCGTNWTGGVVQKDTCESNGLCLNSYNGEPMYWRGSCTDPTWKSPLCLRNLCTDEETGGDPTTNVALTECDDGSWCCNASCCKAGDGIRLAATLGQAITSSTSSESRAIGTATSPTTTSADTSTARGGNAIAIPTAPAIPTPPSPPTDAPTSLSTGAKIGIGVGVSCGVLALGLLLASLLFWRRWKRKQAGGDKEDGAAASASVAPAGWSSHEMPVPNVVHEAEGMRPMAEVDGRDQPVELSAERWSTPSTRQ